MGNPIPNRAQLSQYNVNREGWEVIRQSLYDSSAYAAAGHTSLSFFQVPNGQSSKTLSDTNMALAGQMPANQEFLVQSIEVIFLPTVPAVATADPSSLIAAGAGAVDAIVNDAYKLSRTGNLNLTIGSKTYLQEAPLGRFPGKTGFEITAAALAGVGTTTTDQVRMAYAKACGRPYLLSPADLLLTSNQNFIVTLAWPEGLQTITNPGRLVVVLDGFLYRRSQ